MDLEARNGQIWQQATDYWQLLLKELSRLAHWVRLAKTQPPSSHFGDTAPGLLSASAQVTLACDIGRNGVPGAGAPPK